MAQRDFPRPPLFIPGQRGQIIRINDTVQQPPAKKSERQLEFVFKHPDHSNSIVAGFRKQRDANMNLDVTLRVGPVIIRAHKVFLEAFCSYFDLLFNIPMKELTQNEVELHDVDGKSLSLIIDYAYTNELKITPDNVQDLLQTANFITLEPVCHACCVYLMKNLDFWNCFDILQLATSLGRVQLANSVKRYALERFEDVTSNNEHLVIPPELLIQYLSDNELVITDKGFLIRPGQQESRVFTAVLAYINHDISGRRQLLPMLLSKCVRLSLIDKVTRGLYESNYDEIATSEEAVKLINDTLNLSAPIHQHRSLPGTAFLIKAILFLYNW